MKKLTFSILAGAALVLTSCSDDDLLSTGGMDGYVTFRAELPAGIDTRAFGDGNTAINLQYVVYNKDKSSVLVKGSETLYGRAADIQIPLVTGETYQIIFYADAFNGSADSPYTFNHNDGSLSVDYTKTTANDDKFDAFYKYEKDVLVSSSMGVQTVQLTRPFSQINIGTTEEDFQKANDLNIFPASAKVGVIPAFNKLDMFSGEASGLDEVNVTVLDDKAFGPLETISTGGKTYKNLAMVYVLADNDSRLFTKVDMTLGAQTGTAALAEATKTYTNIPYKRNYRTNIVGNLLTSNTQWSVIIDNEFAGSVWMGETDDVTSDPVNPNQYTITTAAQFAGLAEMVNSGTNFAGKTVVLAADIDLNNTPWTPIGLNADDATRSFKGTFDGQGHTISNLKIESPAAYQAAGLFGVVGGTLKNLVIKNADITAISGSSNGNTTNGIAVAAGSLYNTGTIENVKVYNAKLTGNRYMGGIVGYTYGNVKNCEVEGLTIVCRPDNTQSSGAYDNGDKCGGISGYFIDEGVYEFSGNSVKDFSITAYRDLGGLIGCADISNTQVKNNKAENGTLIVDQSINNYGDKTPNANAVIGRNLNSYDYAVYYNTATNVSVGTAVTSQDAFTSALSGLTAGSSTVICLSDGTYQMPGLSVNANVTIVGTGAANTTLEIANAERNMSESTVTLKNLKVKTAGGAYNGMMRATKITYDYCTIENLLVTYSPVEFNHCVFTAPSDQYLVKVYGSPTADFNACEFKAFSKARGILIYQEPTKRVDVTVKDCSFSATTPYDKGAIQMNTENGTYGILTISNCTYDSNYASLWKEWWNTGDEHTTETWKVIVDGETVQAGTHGL